MKKITYNDTIGLDKKFKIFHKLISVLIILVVLQQMPIIRDNYYGQIRIMLYLTFGLLSFISIFNSPNFLEYNIFKNFFLAVLYAVSFFLISKFLSFNINVEIIFELLIPFGILLCSLNIRFNKKELKNILGIYIVLSTILGVSLLFYYGEGFTITSSYFLTGKNAIGPLLGTSTIILSHSLLFAKNDIEDIKIFSKNNFIKLFLLMLLVLSIIILRNRAGLVGLIVVISLMIIKKAKFKITIRSIIVFQLILIIILILVLTGSFSKLVSPVWTSFTMNYDIYDINSISAGRTNTYLDSLNYSIKYPIIGELGKLNEFYGTAHNYILNKWVKYGIIGSFPFIMFYLLLWKLAIKMTIKNKKGSKKNTIGFWILLFSLIVSIFEYTYPFGPGSSQIIVWFLLGQYLNKTKQKSNFLKYKSRR